MAAGTGAASGHGARSSNAALEASLDRRFQGISNTMESIQSLSGWCIDNKKQSALVVRYWMKWLKKSDHNHRLNLFYLANDVIQNCKRKNAIVFRSAFADVLPNAALLIKDAKVRKSVERILSIWEERGVYPEELINQLKANLNKKEKDRDKQKDKEKLKDKGEETPPATDPAKTKAAIKSKIVEEFAPGALIEQLSAYERVAAEEDFREKQLAALRLDICSTEALKRLKDKAGGNKFAKDFEDGCQTLQDFVGFLEEELKTGPSLLEALENADIFYHTQYKEVKIVANAYSAFANRVASLKRKLDSLKSTLPGSEDSPVPSPSEDAPSPTGSDSPFVGMGGTGARVDPELDGKAMDEGDLPGDGQEDAEASDEEERSSSTAGDKTSVMSPVTIKSDAGCKTPTTPTKVSKANSTAASTSVTPQAPSVPLGVNMAKVDLGKISSILSSLTAAMKNTGSPSGRPSPGTPGAPSAQSTASKATPASPALATILSRVDITPEGILNALSKKNTPALSSLLHNVTNSAPPTRPSPETAATASSSSAKTPKAKSLMGNSLKRDAPSRNRVWEKGRQLSPPPPPPPPRVSPPSLESKINSFLQGNPGFSLALGDASPDGVDGTPVRDEAAATPTQDEIMDAPGSVPESLGSSGSNNLSPTAYRSEPWDAVITPSASNDDGAGDHTSSRYGGAKRSNEPKNARKQAASAGTSEFAKMKKDAQRIQAATAGGGARAKAERRLSAGSRKASVGSEDGGPSGKRVDERSPGKDGGGYHRIETLVSPCTEGAPIETVGYSKQPPAGERIKTVESIRVIGRDSRRGGGAGARSGASMWYEEEEYMEAHSASPHTVPTPLGAGQGGGGDMPPPAMPLPHHLLAHPSVPHPVRHPLPTLPPPQIPFQMLYHAESLQTPPPSHLLHPPLPSPHFFSAPPTIPQPPPPPMSPTLSPSLPPGIMVGGLCLPVDRMQAGPGRHDGAERGGPRGNRPSPRPLLSLLGEPPKAPRPGTVKESFGAHHTPPIHRPGAPGAPPPLLGRVKEPPNVQPPPTSPSTPPPPAADGTPARCPAGLPLRHNAPASPSGQPLNHPPSPVPLLALPTQRPPLLSNPHRPPQRGQHSRHFNEQGGGRFRGNKRPGPPFAGGPFHGPKRPFQPPRY
ncbi:regulation of nuclear pre-mRNA domain-containing protein 2-like isoform X2 [Syngnathus typhle]|uniref:regulation of nuclear pre-mRNA domain-containing protein 2-like isoform X2 n=1 Tax=Syngnathus typhle TaxID=161592 RepID=UPI002A6AAE1A|nr:regulation of nuclear pre-mRNA domain-containing protein 2-like isoform X2 [Syngnathus typhle]